MRRKLLFGIIMLFGAATFAQQTTVWNPAANNPSDGLWSTTENWTNGTPTDVDKAVFNVTDAMACKVNSVAVVNQFVQGDNGSGDTLIIADGGNLTTGAVWSAVGYNNPATMLVETGGMITFGSHMWIGLNAGADANVHINGGVVNVNGNFSLDWNASGNKDTLFLNGGLLNLAQFDSTKAIGENSLISISGGMIKIAGDKTSAINGNVEAGKIVGAETVMFDTVGNFTAVIGAAASATKWQPMAEGDNLWSNRFNWTDFNVPDSNKVQLTTLEECIYDDTAATYVKKFVGGDGGEGGLLTVENGSITTGPEWSAVGWTSPATLNVEEGAQFNFGQHMWIGWKANGPGTVNINGGTVTCAQMFGLGGFGTDGESVGIVNINSGALELTQVHETQSIFDGSYINIEEGELIISRTGTDAMLNYVNDGKIIAYGGKGRVLSRLEGPNIVFYAVYYPDEAVVLKTSPKDGDVAVAIDSDIVVEFYNTMDSASVVDAITMTPAMANTTYAWDQVSKTTLTISGDDMDYLTEYSITIGTGAKDFEGNALAEAYAFSFETDTAPEPAAVNVTFNVDMGECAGESNVYVTGGYNDWTEPGQEGSNLMSDEDGDGIYTVTIEMPANTNDRYKYFVGEGWDGGDLFEGACENTDRCLVVGEEDITFDDTFECDVNVDESKLNTVAIYPNPFTSNITLTNLDNVSNVIVSNVIGQVVLTESVNKTTLELNTSGLERGIYLITIVDNNNNSRTERLIKN